MRFSFCIPFIILLLSLNLVIFDQAFYQREMPQYAEYESEVTNLLQYFKGHELTTENFSERESIHLQDVRNLIWLSLLVGALLAIPVFYSLRTDAAAVIQKQFLKGGLYGIALTALLALTLLFFSQAFTAFHQILFTNDYWLLPADSTLIQMFPQEFFIAATKQILLYSFVFSILSIVVGAERPRRKP